jgi:uncharacterized damage-inducible protein DinB
MEFREIFSKQKQALRRRTNEILALIRPEHLEFRAEKGALTMHEMLHHLWKSEEGVRRVALNNDFAYYETRIPKGLHPTLGALLPLDQELSNLERVHEETLAAVAQCPVELFEQERAREDLNFRRKVWVILMTINEHEIHHRAQIMTYLRMQGTFAPEPIRPR